MIHVFRHTACWLQGLARPVVQRPFGMTASQLVDSSRTFTSVMDATNSNQKFFTVGITGATGLVGKALRNELLQREFVNGRPVRIVCLKRSKCTDNRDIMLLKSASAGSETTLPWNPAGTSMAEILPCTPELDAVVHLAGENIATGLGPVGFLGFRPWSNEKKQEILDSRVESSKSLAKALNENKNSQVAFLAASGVGAYGNQFIGDSKEAVNESMDVRESEGFLAEVSRQAEASQQKAKDNARVAHMRFGVVLSQKGGALAKLVPVFWGGGGGTVGDGRQYLSFVSVRDAARAVVFILETPTLQGAVNVCTPNPCTNAAFTEALGKALSRPTFVPLPAFAVSLLFGEMGKETLLGGVRCIPTKLQKEGFTFLHQTIEEAVKSAFDENDI